MKPKVIKDYIGVLKPRESGLLTFIGVCAAIIAGAGHPPLDRLLLAMIAILLGSAGANGLTNYFDRDIDARMQRTRRRALPSKRIEPPERVLALSICLVVIGLALALWLQPLCFLFGVVGTMASVVWRKRATCVIPQGMLASCAPVLVGWFAIKPAFGWEILLLCTLIAVWLPLHVWSVMIANREDYIGAGLTYFPMSRETREAVKVLLLFSLVLCAAAITLYFIGGFTILYLIVASLLSIAMLFASVRLVISRASKDAWMLYKLSAFPYLGLIFLALCLDIWML
ncbi:MAG: UbiA family prenyltransferase [Chloroflexota bacterium]